MEGDKFRSWIIDSYATLNQISADRKPEKRIIFENNPSGNVWLTTLTQAMRTGHSVEITHQGFDRSKFALFHYILLKKE